MANDLNLSMFRAYDIRTPAAFLSPEFARRLAEAEAMYFREVLGVAGSFWPTTPAAPDRST